MAKETIHQTINSFTKGIDKDTDLSLLAKESYLHAQNFRLITSKGNSSMALENIDGNTAINASMPFTYKVIGQCCIRNTIILFITNKLTPASSGNSMIVKATIGDQTLTGFTTLYDDTYSSDGSRLNFSIQYPITAVSRYEKPTVQKIYWVDGYNLFRFANIVNIPTGQAINKFNIVSSFNVTAPTVLGLTTGSLTAGKIQYAYQLFDLNGGETLFSVPSSLISITSSATTTGVNTDFKGDAIDTKSGKGVRLSITVPTGFTRIRVVSIKYKTINGIPDINIIAEQNIATGITSMLFYDYGTTTLGSYTYEEFAVLNRYIFTATELEIKNNYLFASNISESSWDVDFDARAYRFAGTENSVVSRRGKAAIYKVDGSYDEVSTSYLVAGAQVPTIHDCINPFNDISHDGDTSYLYRYQSNGSIVGGSGLNVSYFFYSGNTFTLDNSTTGNEISCNYTDYSSIDLESKYVGYQRDEIYRFGIIAYNDKGQSSTVKWIGDIRFPSIQEVGLASAVTETSTGNTIGIIGTILNIRFSINTDSLVSQGAVKYQIVRCKREAADRTIVAQGIGYPICKNSYYTPNRYTIPQYFWNDSFSFSTMGLTKQSDILEFISPEVSTNKDIVSTTGDRLDYIGIYFRSSLWSNQNGTYNNSYSVGGLDNSYTIKYRGVVSATPIRKNVTKAYFVDYVAAYDSHIENYAVNDIEQPYQFTNASIYVGGDIIAAPSGSKLIVKVDSAFGNVLAADVTILKGSAKTSNRVGMYNYRKQASQYGGNTYNARQNNTYIACTEVIDTSVSQLFVYKGDTYVAMFDYLRLMNNLKMTKAESTIHQVLYFPVETSINLRFRQDDSYSRTHASGESKLMQEKAGQYTFAGTIFNQPLNLYTYNSVYSQENTTIKYLPKNDNVDYINKKFDTRVIVSEKKINGELFDNWTKFKVDNFIDVDSTYGPIGSMLQHNDQLLFWQEKAFGNIAVNPRSLISDNNPGQLVLGTGTVLERYDYVSTSVGNKGSKKPVVGLNGLYWYDSLGKVIYSYGGQVNPISKLKGLISYLNVNGNSNTTWDGAYDYKYNEVVLTVKGGNTEDFTVAFNELTNSFTSFYSFIPDKYIQVYNKDYYTTTVSGNTTNIYVHNKGSKNTFYGIYSKSNIKFVINDNYGYTKVFDNIQYNSKSYLTTTNGQEDIYADTISTYTAYNSKQNTGLTNIDLAVNTAKRENGFITTMARNAVNAKTNSNVDIFNISNLDTTRQFRERMRDRYLIIDMSYTNVNAYNFSIPYVATTYRMSIR